MGEELVKSLMMWFETVRAREILLISLQHKKICLVSASGQGRINNQVYFRYSFNLVIELDFFVAFHPNKP